MPTWTDRAVTVCPDCTSSCPASSTAITVGELTVAGVAVWAVGHYELVDTATTALGL